MTETTSELSERYYIELAAAFVRGRRPDAPELAAAPAASELADATAASELADEALVAWGGAQGLRLHKFKRSAELPRVRKVLGVLRGIQPFSLVDVGSGRGTFLWPLLDSFPQLPVTAVESDELRARDLRAVRDGGIGRLAVVQADVRELALEPRRADVVTMLEVLEHLRDPGPAVERAVALAQRFVIATVPSKADNNPEHIQLFDAARLDELFRLAGASRIDVEHIARHIVVVANAQRSR